jgi:hypothetical protein
MLDATGTARVLKPGAFFETWANPRHHHSSTYRKNNSTYRKKRRYLLLSFFDRAKVLED